MDAWLNAADPDSETAVPVVEETEQVSEPVKSATAKAAVKAPSNKDIADEFKDLFGS